MIRSVPIVARIPPRGLGCQLEQQSNRGAGLTPGPQFKHLAQQDKGHDDGRGFEIDADLSAMHPKRVGKRGGKESRKHAEDIGDTRSQQDQREHIQAAVAKGRAAQLEDGETRPKNGGSRESKL